MRPAPAPLTVVAAVVAAAGLLAGCGSGDGPGGTAAPAGTVTAGTTPAGHAAEVVAAQDAAGAGGTAGHSGGTRPTTTAGAAVPTPDGVHGFRLNVPLPRPQFVLTDTGGERYDFRARTAGRATLLYFGYTHCTDQCPATLAGFARALDRLPAATRRRITVVFVTTDPKRDTPAVLADYLGYYRSDFVGLTGSQAEVEAAQRAASVVVSYPKREEAPANAFSTAHGGGALAYGLDDHAHVTYPAGTSVTDLVHDLPRLAAGTVH